MIKNFPKSCLLLSSAGYISVHINCRLAIWNLIRLLSKEQSDMGPFQLDETFYLHNITADETGFRLCYSSMFSMGLTCFVHSRLPNARILNIWLNIKNNSSRKRIKDRGMSCNRLYSFLCGINLRSESSLVMSDLHSA